LEKYNCIIIDDEEIARLKAVAVVGQFPNLKIRGQFASAEQAICFLEKEKVDIVFLDIDMHGLSGIELRKQIMDIPVCVFITSHPEHAAASFELETLDYIVKPLTPERFSHTVKRIEEFMDMRHKAKLFDLSYAEDVVYVKEGYAQTKVKLYDIQYIEALKDFSILVTQQKRHCVSEGIGHLLGTNHFKSFIRVHRSYAVQKPYIKKIGTQQIILNNDFKIPIGSSYKENVSLLL
jgi:two-component system, LytTR family, response regulator